MHLYELEEVLKELNEVVLILSEDNHVLSLFDPQKVVKQQVNDYFDETTIEQQIFTSNNKKFHCKKTHYHLNQQTFQIITMNTIHVDDLLLKRLAIYEQIMEHINDGVMASDEEGKIFIYNAFQEKLENMKKSEVIGKYLWEIYRIDPKNSEHRRVSSTKTPIVGRYHAHAFSNNLPQYLKYSTYPLIKDSQSIGAFSICTNETKLKDLLFETLELKRELYSSPSNQRYVDINKNGTSFTFEDIKGVSGEISNVIKQAQNLALYNLDILLIGETGTGKELFAQSIHNYSPRSNDPFVAVNCAAIPETLLEITLFGSTKGAFTGAIDQIGLFESAKEGTLFLDEINSLQLSLQSKIIRVLEERKIRRLGSNKLIPIHCNIITASNEDPQKLINENKLRLDLYYRIATTTIEIPPLRNRPADIKYYIQYFLKELNKKHNRSILNVSPELEQLLINYSWPGNIRELKHLIENMYIQTDEYETIISSKVAPKSLIQSHLLTESITEDIAIKNRKKITKEEIQQILETTNYSVTRTAEILNMSRQNLQYYLKKFQLNG